MKLLAAITILLIAGVTAYAADVDGKWGGSMSTPGGDFPVAFTLKADGTTLTGSTAGFDGSEVQIKDGKIEGNTISFTVTFDFGGMPFLMSYKGVVSPTEIKMNIDVAGMPLEVVLKKEK